MANRAASAADQMAMLARVAGELIDTPIATDARFQDHPHPDQQLEGAVDRGQTHAWIDNLDSQADLFRREVMARLVEHTQHHLALGSQPVATPSQDLAVARFIQHACSHHTRHGPRAHNRTPGSNRAAPALRVYQPRLGQLALHFTPRRMACGPPVNAQAVIPAARHCGTRRHRAPLLGAFALIAAGPAGDTMSGMIFYFFKALAVIFTMVDPLGVVPVMIGLTGGYTKHERSRIATNATLIAGGVILVFGVIGRPLFSWLQVSTQAFDIAGGLLLFLVAVDMLFGRPSGVRKTPREEHEARIQEDVTVFPLAIPMIAGPGTITTVILLVGDAWPNGLELLMIAAAAAITLAATWVALQTSGRIQARLGTAGIAVLSRVLGMVLAAIAVQFVLNGVGPFLAHVLTTR